MWSLKLPNQSAGDVFSICISRVRNKDFAQRLAAAKPAIEAASIQLDQAARTNALHTIPTHDIVAPDITQKEMEGVYTGRMASKAGPGRNIYDEIFTSAPQGRCPLCMQRIVATLDHHLPKTSYPALAVAPLNLIPCCTDCNRAKLSNTPTVAEDAPLHPYYDNLGDDIWLTATVLELQPTALKYFVTRSEAWDDTLYARVNNHFESLSLAALFASQAADELMNIRYQLHTYLKTDSAVAVRAELQRRLQSSTAVRRNSWRTAAFRAWSESDWFCNGGFL